MSAQRSGIYRNLKLIESSAREPATIDIELFRHRFCFVQIAYEQAHLRAFVTQRRQHRARPATSANQRATRTLQRSKQVAQRRDESRCVSVISVQFIVLDHDSIYRANF